jgi:MraZ protein
VKKNNDFIRRFTAGVKVVEIDALGIIGAERFDFAVLLKRLCFHRQ